mgnify:CR=1 FL=1
MTVSIAGNFSERKTFSVAVIQVFGHTFVHPVPEHIDATQGHILMTVHVFPDGKDKSHAAPHNHSLLCDGSEYIVHIDDGPEDTGHIHSSREVKKDKVIVQSRVFQGKRPAVSRASSGVEFRML